MNIQFASTLHPRLFARVLAATFGIALAIMTSSSVLAENMDSQAKTASVHAGLAANSADIKGVHTHLHHSLNCLVGPDGDGFDESQMNPCEGMGKGAISDAIGN